ncbi:cell division inhibitor [Aeromonas sanarellii]
MNQPLSHRPLSSSAGLITTWPTRHQSKMGHEQRLGANLHETPLLDALGRLSQSDRGWILLIAPPGLPVAEQLQAQGINPARVLVVHGRKIKNWQRLLEQSLINGHCAAVLTWLPEQVALDRGRLNTLGQRAGVLTRFFEPVPSRGGALGYGGQDVYLNH